MDGGTELNETARRVASHWWLILLFVLLGVGAAAAWHGRGGDTYTASSRLVMDTEDPKSRAESMAIADTAEAIATSPSSVRAALAAAHVSGRDPLDVAKKHVSVRPLGTSAVVQLSVSDRNRHAAAALANALAGAVIRTRLDVNEAELDRVMSRLQSSIDGLNERIATLEASIDRLNAAITGGGDAATLNPKRATAERLRDALVQQRAVLEAQRVSLISSRATRPRPEIISRAMAPAHADPSRWLPDLLLGGLLGLVLGVAAAAILEAFRPTLVGGDAVAREVGGPLLGEVRSKGEEGFGEGVERAALRLRLAAEAAGVDRVALVGTGNGDLAALAHALEGADPAPDANGAAAARLRIAPLAATAPLSRETGLVFVAPSRIERSELVDAKHLLSVTPGVLLGSITHAAKRRRHHDEKGSVVGVAPQS